MKFTFASNLQQRLASDVLILPFWEGPSEAVSLGSLKEAIRPLLESGDFKGKNGEGVFIYPKTEKEKRILLLGLGPEEKVTVESLRRGFSNGLKSAWGRKARGLQVAVPQAKGLSRQATLRGVAEGLFLTHYSFNQLKGETKKEALAPLESIGWIGVKETEEAVLQKALTIAEGVYLARELVNGNADDVTPQKMAETALGMQKRFPKLKATIYDKKWLEKEKMGLILAVGQGARHEPCLIQLSYKGNPKSKKHLVFVGKGVTFDTGGLCLKPADNMLSMKCDMAGGAAVLAAVQTAAALNLKVNVTALVPSVENAIDANSYKQGDVFRSYSGKTVEVTNTDAEGRLILADALTFAVRHLEPTHLIDLATLTGAIVVALGEEYTGCFANDDRLSEDLLTASSQTGELIWRMPLYPDYKEALKSDIADMINSAGRDGGSIKAALFLQEFVEEISWAHLDIAGPAYLTKPRYYHPNKGTGHGVRLLIEYLEKHEGS